MSDMTGHMRHRVATGRVFEQTLNVEQTDGAPQATREWFRSSDYWKSDFWTRTPSNPVYVNFSVSYTISRPTMNTVDGKEVTSGDALIVANVNQADATLLVAMKTALAAYLTVFLGEIYTINDIRGCSL